MKLKINFKLFLFLILILIGVVFLQRPIEGLQKNSPNIWAFKNAKIFINPDNYIENGILVIRDGIIESVSENIIIPDEATILDLKGKTIYPGFIESWYPITPNNQIDTIQSLHAHWNSKVHARRDISNQYLPNHNQLKSLHEKGFTAAHIVADTSIFRGKTAFIHLNEKNLILDPYIAQNIAYEVDGWGSDLYPNSLLGVVALIRQTILDALWYKEAKEINLKYPKNNKKIDLNIDLNIIGEAIGLNKPFIFETRDELFEYRSKKIAEEFSLKYWIKGNGYEYRRINYFLYDKPFFIIPLDFPNTPDLSHPYNDLQFSISELRHWELAPYNPSVLEKNNIQFAITSDGLNNKDFHKNLIKSIKHGLSKNQALASITTIPAQNMNMATMLGQIKPGYIANLTIVDGDYFNENIEIHSVWIQGKEIPIKPKYLIDMQGVWDMNIENRELKLKIRKNNNKYSGMLAKDSIEYKIKNLVIDGRNIGWHIIYDSTKAPTRYFGHILNGTIEGNSSKNESWLAIRAQSQDIKKDISEIASPMKKILYPEGAYGLEETENDHKSILIKNGTIWTSSSQNILYDYDILIQDGKISKIDKNIIFPNSELIIDANGKHITPGLIDCHSHSAAFSINEGTQSITSEVRIEDVINSDDIAIYRQLAGGITTANILHGSANAIGGQNAVIKLRWGKLPEGLLFKNAKKGIKFALGENVKQSNWGDDYTSRYPQTRMGVEQIIRDAFLSAKEYQMTWKDYNSNKNKWKKLVPPRVDLELEALVEILNGDRLIHCHSYRQDEILMLTRLAEEFDFTIGTFQHVLEGYKVADVLRDHGAGASTFSDWWAYKYEVIDAIPFNATLMSNIGVNVSLNSDSNELARRMNTESAKAVKYGGLSEIEALKLVTINPAKQLGIDQWVGSIEIGKDADIVIWSDNPLSTKAKCEQTLIDGMQYFSLKSDTLLRRRDHKIREELIAKILNDNNKSIKKWKHHEQNSSEVHNCLD